MLNPHREFVYKRLTPVFFLSVFIANFLFAQEELLLKIPANSNYQIRLLKAHYNVKLRYRTQDFSIIQANQNALPELPSPQILDSISPDFGYYLLWLDDATEKSAIEAYGEILDQFSGLFLLKLHSDFEPVLFNLPVHHRAKLPSDILIPELDPAPFAPSIPASPQQQAIIQGLLKQVDSTQWFWQIIALVENEDLQQPGKFFQSRYALRVREAVQLDGEPKLDHACDNAADYIANQFRSFGLEVEFDSFTHRRRETLGGLVGEYVMRNVVGTLPGKGPNKDRLYLMVGHYDSIASKTPGWDRAWRTLPAPGASDNASGIADILETARILSAGDYDYTIKFIAFSGEELFLLGSKHYRDLVKARGDQIVGVLNFDLLGHDEDGILDIHVLGDEQSQWLVNAFGRAAERYNIQVDLRRKNDPSFIFSDHSPFWEIGVSAVMVSEESSLNMPEESTAYIHSEDDNLAKISHPRLGELAIKLAVATLAELARPIMRPGNTGEIRPDISWESREIHLSNPNPAKGDEITLRASVKNAGPVAIAGIAIQFVAIPPDGPSEIIFKKAVDLDVDQSQTLSTTFTPTAWGEFTLRATANADARFFESDFSNNQLETRLPVTDPGVTIESIFTYPNPINFNNSGASLRFVYTLSRDANVVLAIYDTFGEKVFKEEFSAGSKNGKLGVNDSFTWSGRKTLGEKIAAGVYIGQITATTADGASTRGETKFAVIW